MTRCVSSLSRVGFFGKKKKKEKKILQRSVCVRRRQCACATGTFTTCHTSLYFTWGKRELSSTCVNAAAEWCLTVSGDKRKTRLRDFFFFLFFSFFSLFFFFSLSPSLSLTLSLLPPSLLSAEGVSH